MEQKANGNTIDYTDKQLKDATQIAYLSFIENTIKVLEGKGEKPPFTLRHLITEHINYDLAKREIKREEPYNIQGIEKKSLQELLEYSNSQITGLTEQDKEIIGKLNDDVLDWKIVYTHNTIFENGLYGCVIETNQDNAIVAFRGSEGFDTYSGAIHDWAHANIGAINNAHTEQQLEVQRFSRILMQKKVLDKYKSIEVTGHSLGGSLASHFCIANAMNAKRKEEIFDKIRKVVNFDGQGFSNAYLETYDKGIKLGASKITHYKWSAVGNLLNPVPGENGIDIKTNDLYSENSLLIHHTDSIDFDENGMIQKGKQSTLSKVLGEVSRSVDSVPKGITDEIWNLAATIFETFFKRGDDDTIELKNPFEFLGKDNTLYKVFEKCKQGVKTFINFCKNRDENEFNNMYIESAMVGNGSNIEIPKDNDEMERD